MSNMMKRNPMTVKTTVDQRERLCDIGASAPLFYRPEIDDYLIANDLIELDREDMVVYPRLAPNGRICYYGLRGEMLVKR